MTSSLSGLKYAGKQKKTMFSGGSDKDYMLKTLHWTSIMTSLHFTGRIIPKECYANLFYGVLSQYTPLVRSSLLVLLNTVSQLSGDEQSVLELCSMLLDRYRKGKEYLNLEDPLCAAYFLRIIGALGHSVDWRHAECKARVLDLFVVAGEFFKNKSVKVVCETVSLFVDHSYSWSILGMLHERAAPRVVPQMIDALIEHIKHLPCESTSMPLVHRTCVKLGRFLISRPYNPESSSLDPTKSILSAHHTEKDGEALIPLWIALKKHHYKPLLLPCSLPTNLSALISADVISTPNETTYYACHDNPRVSHPHMLCEAIKAFIWLAPDKRYCKKEHRQLWTAFAGNLSETVRALSATPSVGEALLEGLLSNLYARVRASMLVAPHSAHMSETVSANGHQKHNNGDVDLLFDASDHDTVKTSNNTTKLGNYSLHYDSLYVDTLLSVAENILTASHQPPTNRSLTYIQNLWSFVALLANSTAVAKEVSVVAAVKTSAPAADFNNLLSMDFTDTSTSSVASSGQGGGDKNEEVYKSHVRCTLLRSILHVLEFSKHNSTMQVVHQQQVLLSIHASALWHLAEHALLWTNISNVTEYLHTKGAVKSESQVLTFAPPPVADLFGSASFTQTASSDSAVKVDHKHAALSVIVSLLSEACATDSGTMKKTGLQGLVKICNALYLSAAVNGSHRSTVTDSSLDAHIHSQLVHHLVRVFLTHFAHTLTSEGHSAVDKLLHNSSATGSDSFLKTFLSFVRLYPQDITSTETVGDRWRSSVGSTNSDDVLSLLLGSIARSSVLYISLVSSLLVLFEYSEHIGLSAPQGRALATITPLAPRKASLIVCASSGAEHPVVAAEVSANDNWTEQNTSADDEYNFDFAPSQTQVQQQQQQQQQQQSGGGDDDFGFPSFDAPAPATPTPAKIHIPTAAKGASKLKPPAIKTIQSSKSTASIVSSTSDGNAFDWPASTTSSAAPLSSIGGGATSSFGGWDDAPLSAASSTANDTSFASPASTTASFGWGAADVVAPSATGDAFSASTAADSGGAWGAATSTNTTAGGDFGGDLFAPTATSFTASSVPSAGDDDMFSFSASNSAPSVSGGSTFAASESSSGWASTGAPSPSTKPPVVPLLSKPTVPTLSAPKKITPLKKGGGGLNSVSTAVLTPSVAGGADLFGLSVLTPASTTGASSEWGASNAAPSFDSSGFAPSSSDGFSSSFAASTSAVPINPPLNNSNSSGYGDDFGGAGDAVAASNSSGYGDAVYDYSVPAPVTPVVLHPTMSSFNLAPVAPSQPAKDLISDLFGEAAPSDVALPQMMPMSMSTSTPSSATKSTGIAEPAVDLFGGGSDSLFPPSAKPQNGSSFGDDLFSSTTPSVATSTQSTPPAKTVPLLAKPTALVTAKARASALKRTPSVSSVGSGSVQGGSTTSGGDDFDIFSTPAPAAGAGRAVRSTSISSVASHESSQSQQSVFSVQSHQSAAFPASTAANTSHFSSTDTDLFGVSNNAKPSHSTSSANMFEDNGWGGSAPAAQTASRPQVPVLSKPVVPTLTKPSGPAVKINPFAPPATASGASNVTAKAKAAAAAAAAKRGSVATTGGIHSDLMNLDMPVLTATDATPVAAPSGWPSATPTPAARTSFTSPPVDPFASSHNFAAPAPAPAPVVDAFAPATSGATDAFAPSTSATASAFAPTTSDTANAWGGPSQPAAGGAGYAPQNGGYGQQYAQQPAAFAYGYGAPAAPGYDPAAAAAHAAYYAQQQAYAADPQYAAYYAQQAAAGGYPPQQYGQQPQYNNQYPPQQQQQQQYGGYQYPPQQGQQQQAPPAAPGQYPPANFGYSPYVPK
eukprot:gene24103-30406_t